MTEVLLLGILLPPSPFLFPSLGRLGAEARQLPFFAASIGHIGLK